MTSSYPRFFLLTSGKGGSGRTPLALMISAILFERGRNVVLLDLNFSNPDAFFIATKIVPRQHYFMGIEHPKKVSVLEDRGNIGVRWPLRVYDIMKTEKNFFKAVARIEKYLYTPISPADLFKTLKLIIDSFKKVDVVIDTNLNIPSLKPQSEEDYKLIKKILLYFSDHYIIYIWSPGTLARRTKIREKEISEFDLIIDTISNYKVRGVNLFGDVGEKIVHVITPNLYEKLERPIFEKIIEFLKWAVTMKIPKEIEVIRQVGETENYLKKIVEAISMMQLRREGYLRIDQLKEITDEYAKRVQENAKRTPDFGLDAKSVTIVYHFFGTFLEKINELWRREHPSALLPENLIIVPYMVERMVNYVEALLSAEAITLDTIKGRAQEISNILATWLTKQKNY